MASWQNEKGIAVLIFILNYVDKFWILTASSWQVGTILGPLFCKVFESFNFGMNVSAMFGITWFKCILLIGLYCNLSEYPKSNMTPYVPCIFIRKE